MVFTMSNIHS
ncbi:hypothetical protein ECNE037_3552, partial [Escherichia coli NE037]